MQHVHLSCASLDLTPAVLCRAVRAVPALLGVSLVRYYAEKMQAPPGQQDGIIRKIVAAYVEGLCWVMRYYYEGVASWEW